MYIGMNMANGKTEEKTDYTQNAIKRDKENNKNAWKEISKNSSCDSRKPTATVMKTSSVPFTAHLTGKTFRISVSSCVSPHYAKAMALLKK